MPELRRKILDASVELVAEKGVRGVSFREVARRAGVSHQAPYHEFKNHLAIMRAVAQEGFAQLDQAMREAADAKGPDPLDALSAAGMAYVHFARDHVGHFRVMFQGSLVDLRDAPMEEADRTHGTLARLAAEAQAAGYGSGLSSDEIAHLCWASVHGISLLLVEGVLAPKLSEAMSEDGIAQQVVAGMAHLLGRWTPSGSG